MDSIFGSANLFADRLAADLKTTVSRDMPSFEHAHCYGGGCHDEGLALISSTPSIHAPIYICFPLETPT
jgi:hypothetical protein